MSTEKRSGARLPERGAAWFAAFLLAVFIIITLTVTVFLRAVTSAELHLSVASDPGMLDRQLQAIYSDIDLMAEEYGFPADQVKAAVSREELEDFNRKAAAWWTQLLTEGTSGTIPRWNSGGIESVIRSAAEDRVLCEEPYTVIADLIAVIDGTAFPVRESVTGFGTGLVNDKIDLRGVIRSSVKLPTLGLVLILGCAGLIALLLGRDPFSLLKYYGTAAAAAGTAVLAGCIAFLAFRPGDMIAEASAGLADQFATLAGKTGPAVLLAGGVLLAAGYFCLFLYSRKAGRNGTAAEKTA